MHARRWKILISSLYDLLSGRGDLCVQITALFWQPPDQKHKHWPRRKSIAGTINFPKFWPTIKIWENNKIAFVIFLEQLIHQSGNNNILYTNFIFKVWNIFHDENFLYCPQNSQRKRQLFKTSSKVAKQFIFNNFLSQPRGWSFTASREIRTV